MKALGMVMLVLGGFLLGLGRAGELKRRVSLLTELLALMQGLRAEIAWSARPLQEILALDESCFCKEARAREDFQENPAGALARTGEALLSRRADRELLAGFAKGLGASDTQGQLSHLELYMALTKDSLAGARAEYAQKYRLYTALGLFGGLAVCVVLL